MDYGQALRYLDSFVDYEKIGYRDKRSFDLERMHILAEILGNPERSFPSIHIAGTKGKGSTASFIAGILKEAGFRVGLYTSPHLISLRERIKINGEMINESDLARHAGDVSSGLMEKSQIFPSLNNETSPFTFFEIFTILAFNYFKAKKIDYGVIEAGLGGRLDATNIIRPLVSVISPVSYDHMAILGDNLESIAFEKSGIIKAGRPAVSAPQKEEVLGVIRKACSSKNADLILAGRDIRFKEIEHDVEKEIFDVHGMLGSYLRCTSRLIGRHQIVNAASAIGAVEILKKSGVEISGEHIKKGIEKTKVPARCEIIARNPYVVLDGAQNRASAHALKETIKRNFNYKNLFLVLGVSKEKDIRGICEELVPMAEVVILTRAKNERGEDPYAIARVMEDIVGSRTVLSEPTTSLAAAKAREMAQAEDMILITGSFFVIEEVKEEIAREKLTV